MRHKLLTYTLHSALLLFTLNCSTDNASGTSTPEIEVTAVTTYGGSANDSYRSVVATQDGGYAVLGYTQSTDGDISDKQDPSFDYWLLKFNAEHALQWQKTYGGTADDRGTSLIETSDGGFAMLGFSFSSDGDVTSNAGLQDYWLAKVDANGAMQWQKSFGFSGTDSGLSVIQTRDQGFLLSGILDVTASGGEGNSSRGLAKHAGGDYWILKLNATGALEWSYYFGGNFTDTPEGAVQLEDNSYIIVGGSDSNDTDISTNKGTYDFWVIRVSPTGELLWERSYGGDQIDEARGISATDDGNFIIVGDTRSNTIDVSQNKGGADLWLLKIAPDGTMLWEKTYGGSNFDVGRAILRSQTDGFVVAGSSRSNNLDVVENKGQNDAWVLKVSPNGDLLWEYSVGGSNIDFAYGIAELTDQTIIAVGDSASDDGDILENKGFSDALIIQLK
jgi:hypothetical protein